MEKNITIHIKKRMFLKITFVTVFFAICNILFYNSEIVSCGIILLQFAILIYLYLKKGIAEYLAYYISFMCSCLEFSGFVGNTTFYNLKSVELCGINLGIWLLLPVLIKIFIKPIRIGKIKSKYIFFYRLGFGLIGLNIIAAILGILTIIFNDNNVQSISGVVGCFIEQLYSFMFLPFVMISSMSYIMSYECKKVHLISYALQATLIGNVTQTIVSVTTHSYGNYGGVETALMSTVYFVMPFMMLFFIGGKDIMYPKITSLFGVIGTLLALKNSATGKLIIVVVIVFIIVVIYVFKSKNRLLIIAVTMLLISAVFLLPMIIEELKTSSVLFASKYNQAIRLLEFWKDDWFSQIPASPRVRIEEILNVIVEFAKKPWFIITGKGYMGTVKDVSGYLKSLESYAGLCTEIEWNTGLFFNLHEFSTNLLLFGLMGILYSIDLVRVTVKKFRNNIWLLIGSYWFLVIYGYSYTLSVFCMMALAYGLFFASVEKE